MSERLRKTRPLTSLLDDLLSMQVPENMRRKLAGLRADGARKKGRPKKGTLELPPNSTFGSALVMSLVCRALAGDVAAQKLCFYLVEGIPVKTVPYSSVANVALNSEEMLAKLQLLFSRPTDGALPPQAAGPESPSTARPEPAMSLSRSFEPEPDTEPDEVF